MFASAPRVEWAPDGARLLTCARGELVLHALHGARRRIGDAFVWYDARWRSDGTIAALDEHGILRSSTMHGEPYADAMPSNLRPSFTAGAIAPGGGAFVLLGPGTMRVVVGPRAVHVGEGIGGKRGHAILSADGTRLAVGYATEPRGQADPGRGWAVLDLRPQRRPASSYYYEPPPPIVDRAWYAVPLRDLPMRLAFDAKARRLAIATPEPEPTYGVIRVGGEAPQRTHDGGAVAVALDGRGVVAAYAYPPNRLRVDYLPPQVKGPANVEIVDTLWIESDLAPVALALDAEARRIACLGADGAVEIVPVP